MTNSDDIRRVLRSGRILRGPGLTLAVLPSECSGPRLAMAVRATNAVRRNRIKRRLRAAAAAADLGAGVDIVARADDGIRNVDFQDLVITFEKVNG